MVFHEQDELAAQLRAEVARANVPYFKIAARADVHPATLSALLHGRRPIPTHVAERIFAAARELAIR